MKKYEFKTILLKQISQSSIVKTKYFFSFFLLLICFSFTSCTKDEKPSKPLILVSIPPYKTFVEKIVKGHFKVESIVPAGVDSHTFEPKPKQIRAYHHAKAWFRIGDPYEEKLVSSLKANVKDLKIYNLGSVVHLLSYDEDTIEVSDHHHHGIDIHFWMSPPMVALQAAKIADVLVTLAPDHESDFRENLKEFTKELSDLDDEIREILGPLKYRTFLTSHPSFGYFCHEYNLEQISLETEGKEALPREIEKIIRLAREKKVQVVLTEPQFSSKAAKIVAKRLNLPVRMVDPYSEEYKKSLLRIAKVLRDPS